MMVWTDSDGIVRDVKTGKPTVFQDLNKHQKCGVCKERSDRVHKDCLKTVRAQVVPYFEPEKPKPYPGIVAQQAIDEQKEDLEWQDEKGRKTREGDWL